METVSRHLAGFGTDESGAVTVDWVVLTGALVGLGLAVMSVVRTGVEDLSGDTRDVMLGNIVRTSFERLGDLFSTDFSTGRDGWSGGDVVDLAGFGEVLRIGPNGVVDMVVDVPPDAETATVTFDIIGADDISGEAATILIDGVPVATYADDHGRITRTDLGAEGITVEVTQHYDNRAVGSGDHGSDSRATYTITIDDPSEAMLVSVESGTDRPISEEFFAIDDVSVRAD